jgi:alkylhydroperoxidase family enzyme
LSDSTVPARAPRITPGTFGDLGIVNWAICRVLARRMRMPRLNVFATIARDRGMFRGWMHLIASSMLSGTLNRHDTECVIVRVAALRNSAYELNHHRRLARAAGVPVDVIALLEDPACDLTELPDRTRELVAACDQLVTRRYIDDEEWAGIAEHLSQPQLLEFVMLVGTYDSLAALIDTIGIEVEGASAGHRPSGRSESRPR